MGLFNCCYFIDVLCWCLEVFKCSNVFFVLVLIDVDYFKCFNDNYVYDVGDMVLWVVGFMLEKECDGDELFCWIGGEEFMLLFVDIILEVVQVCVNDICQVIEKIMVWYGEKNLLKIIILVGLFGYLDYGVLLQDLMKIVDDVFYKFKVVGWNQVMVVFFVDEDME